MSKKDSIVNSVDQPPAMSLEVGVPAPTILWSGIKKGYAGRRKPAVVWEENMIHDGQPMGKTSIAFSEDNDLLHPPVVLFCSEDYLVWTQRLWLPIK